MNSRTNWTKIKSNGVHYAYEYKLLDVKKLCIDINRKNGQVVNVKYLVKMEINIKINLNSSLKSNLLAI